MNQIKYKSFGIALSLLFCLSLEAEQLDLKDGINGQINLTLDWEPVIYLSYIPNMTERFTMSSEMIIDEAKVDKNGNFHFPTDFLPEEDALYRLHISKKGYPKATLIIGGSDQNFLFIVANRKSTLFVTPKDSSSFFSQLKAEGYSPNHHLELINQWHRFTDSAHFAGTTLKKELIVEAIDAKMRALADTSSNLIVALYALYNGHFEKDIPTNESFYESFLDKWNHNESDQFLTFKSHFGKKSSKPDYTIWYAGVFGFIGGVLFMLFWHNKRKERNPLDTLSIQERKVYNLLLKGMSNKEISEECNIGVNTVKSHVSSIYTKLKVKSRKELINKFEPPA